MKQAHGGSPCKRPHRKFAVPRDFDFNVPGEDARIILDRAAEVIDSIEFFKIREDLFDGRNYYEHNYEMVGDQMVWYFQRPGGGELNIRIGAS